MIPLENPIFNLNEANDMQNETDSSYSTTSSSALTEQSTEKQHSDISDEVNVFFVIFDKCARTV